MIRHGDKKRWSDYRGNGRMNGLQSDNAAVPPCGCPFHQGSALHVPKHDPAPIFELFRCYFASEMLIAAVGHFKVFETLASGPLALAELRRQLNLAERPAIVLSSVLLAQGLLRKDRHARLALTELAAEHLLPGGEFDVTGYLRLLSDRPGVQELIERLRSNRPAQNSAHSPGVAFMYRPGMPSAMEDEAHARDLTLALEGRAKNTAPIFAECVPLGDARLLLDVGGGTGFYGIACLRKNPQLRAIVLDRPEVLKVTCQLAATYGVADRLDCLPGDMFHDPVPAGVDVVLLSNVLHD